MERKKKINRIYTILLILFLLEVVMFPIVVWRISEKEADSNVHTVTFEDNKLECDNHTDVDENGTISIPLFDEKEKKEQVYVQETKEDKTEHNMDLSDVDLFDSDYGNVMSSDGTKVIAPGTKKTSIVRVSNTENINLRYNAVLYKNVTTSKLPIEISLKGDGETAEPKYFEGVYNAKDVIRSLEGEIKPGESKEFEISWNWDYSTSELQDIIDTELGNRAAYGEPDRVVVGFRIVAEEALDSYIVPIKPKTGDTTEIGGYIVLMALSLFVLILIFIEKEKDNEENSKYNFKDI